MQGRIRRHLITLFAGGIVSFPVIASADISDKAAPKITLTDTFESVVLSLGIGPAWQGKGKDQTVILQSPDILNRYLDTSIKRALMQSELFLGIQKTLGSNIKGQLGLALGANTEAKLKGDMLEDADPRFNNLDYAYELAHYHISLKGRMLLERYAIKPYLGASVGVGFNHSYNYQNTANNAQTVAPPPFTKHTKTSVTYSLEAGTQTSLSAHWRVGLGYVFSDWGKSELGASSNQTTHQRLGLNHFYSHQLQLSLNYLS